MNTKKLYIIRHAKAELPTWGLKDYDRNLIDKGKDRATVIATKLTPLIRVDTTTILTSTANRALQTAEIFCKTLQFPFKNIHQHKEIYEAYYLDLLKLINTISSEVDNLMLFGHNPGLTDLTNYICNTYIDLKTSHVAVVELEDGIDFASLSGGTGTLVQVIAE